MPDHGAFERAKQLIDSTIQADETRFAEFQTRAESFYGAAAERWAELGGFEDEANRSVADAALATVDPEFQWKGGLPVLSQTGELSRFALLRASLAAEDVDQEVLDYVESRAKELATRFDVPSFTAAPEDAPAIGTKLRFKGAASRGWWGLADVVTDAEDSAGVRQISRDFQDELQARRLKEAFGDGVLRDVQVGLLQAGGNLQSLALRMTGQDEAADRTNRRLNETERAANLADRLDGDSETAGTAIRGITSSLSLVVLGGAAAKGGAAAVASTSAVRSSVAGLPGASQALAFASSPVNLMAGGFGVLASNQAITAGRDAGLTGGDLAAYSLASGTIEASLTYAFGRVFGPGLEGRVTGQGLQAAVGAGLLAASRELGKDTLRELPEELAIEVTQSVLDKVSGVDPAALSADALYQTITQTVIQTIGVAGLAGAPNAIGIALRSDGSPGPSPLERAQRHLALAAESGMDPVREGRIADLAARTGQEPALLRALPAALLDSDRLDLAAVSAQSPGVARFLAASPTNAVVAKADGPALAAIEQLLSQPTHRRPDIQGQDVAEAAAYMGDLIRVNEILHQTGLRGASNSKAEEALQTLGLDGDALLDAEVLQELYQTEQGPDAAHRLGLTPEQVADAVDRGEALKVPKAKLLSGVAPDLFPSVARAIQRNERSPSVGEIESVDVDAERARTRETVEQYRSRQTEVNKLRTAARDQLRALRPADEADRLVSLLDAADRRLAHRGRERGHLFRRILGFRRAETSPAEAADLNQPENPTDVNREAGRADQQPEAARSLPGAPASAIPNAKIQGIARRYATAALGSYRAPLGYAKVDPARAKRIADVYEAMTHAPADPQVAEAYAALAQETLAQWNAMREAGVKVEPISGLDPYAAAFQRGEAPSASAALWADLAKDHIWYYRTEDGFGTGETDTSTNPLLAPAGVKDDAGNDMLVNDVFRVVHDYFGHGTYGTQFGPSGEESAWLHHASMFTPVARRALTTETRGQNSWVNYGPYGEQNRKDPANTRFADQKTGLLPAWVSEEGLVLQSAADVFIDGQPASLRDELAGVAQRERTNQAARGVQDEEAVLRNVQFVAQIRREKAARQGRVLDQSAAPGAAAEHFLNVKRARRATGARVQWAEGEQAAIAAAAEALKLPSADLEKRVRKQKLAHPAAGGWSPWVFGKAILDEAGRLQLSPQPQPYTFHADQTGKPYKEGTAARDKRTSALAAKLRDEVLSVVERATSGDQAAAVILRQADWYRGIRDRIRREFGGLGDLFADMLGATSPNTPVRTNWDSSIEALQLATRGDYDALFPRWLAWYEAQQTAEGALIQYVDEQRAAGVPKKDFTASAEYKNLRAAAASSRELPLDLEPLKANGKRFGFNGRNVLRALIDTWRVVQDADPTIGRGPTAPKAVNFSGNLIGFREGATIDVWAARLLQRVAHGNRMPAAAEQGASGAMRADGSTTGPFGFGQEVFAKAAELVRGDPVASQNEKLVAINPDDLQALAWFLEKERWAADSTTSTEGAGGSFELEADLTGTAFQDKVKELRRAANSSKSTPEQRDEALAALSSLVRSADRYQAGLSIQRSELVQGLQSVPDDAAQAAVAAALRAAAYEADPGARILASKALSTEGRYDGVERAIDLELVTREGYNPRPLMVEALKIADDADQDSVFLSRVLRTDEVVDPSRHRPGLELYFRQGAPVSVLTPVLDRLAEAGLGYYTVVVDGRPTPAALGGAMPAAVGLRFQYVPEFDVRYGNDEFLKLSDDADIVKRMESQAYELLKLANTLLADTDVSAVQQLWYDTDIRFQHEFKGTINAYSTRNDTEVSSSSEAGPRLGRPHRETVAAAARQRAIASERPSSADESGAGRTFFQPVQPALPSVRELIDAGVKEIPLRHWSTSAKLSTVDPKHYGRNNPGAESRRRRSAPQAFKKRVFFGGPSYRREPGLGAYAYETVVPASGLYNMAQDPAGLKDQVRAALARKYGSIDQLIEELGAGDANDLFVSMYERAIDEAGFSYMYDPESDIVQSLRPQKVVRVLDQGGGAARPRRGYESEMQGASEHTGDPLGRYQPLSNAAVGPEGLARVRQELDQARRGSVRIADKGYLVSVFDAADASTIVHELGHIFLEEFRLLIESGDASRDAIEDWQSIQSWLGVDIDEGITTAQHERFAAAWEQYLMEGQAPLVKLQGAFGRFRTWLLEIYKSAKSEYFQSVRLTREVRQVFDRMLATEKEVAEAVFSYELTIRTDAELDALGLSPAEKETVNSLYDMGRAQVEERLSAARNKELRKHLKEFKREADAEVHKAPVYQAIRYIQENGGLRWRRLLPDFGQDTINDLRARHGDKLISPVDTDTGLQPEDMADQFGFDSSEALLLELIDAPSRREAVQALVDQKLAAADLGFDPAQPVAESEEFAKAMDAMAGYYVRAGRETETLSDREAVKQRAARYLADMPLKDAVRQDLHLQRMRSAIQKERRALIGKDIEQASTWAAKARLAHEMAHQSVDIRKLREQTLGLARRAARKPKKGARQTIDEQFLHSIRALLTRFNLAPKGQPQPPQDRAPLVELLASADLFTDQAGQFGGWLLGGTEPLDHRRLTVSQFRELAFLLKSLETQGRDAVSVLINGERRLLDDVRKELMAPILALKPKKRFTKEGTLLRKVADLAADLKGRLRMLDFIVAEADGFAILKEGARASGPNSRLIVDNLHAADAAYRELGLQLEAKIAPAMKQLLSGASAVQQRLHKVRPRLPEAFAADKREWNPERVFAVALNLGNKYNAEATAKGFGMEVSELVHLTSSTMSSSDWAAIQTMWDAINSMRSSLFGVHKKLYGWTPLPVDPDPLSIRTYEGQEVQLRGGYYPLRFDGSLDQTTSDRDDAADIRESHAAAFPPSLQKGFLLKREGSGGRPVKLSLAVLGQHVDYAARFITHAEKLRTIYRVLNNESYSQAMREHMGPEEYRALMNIIKHVANPGPGLNGALDRMFDKAKGLATQYVLFWNLRVPLNDIFSLPGFFNEVGGFRKGAQAYASGLRHILGAWHSGAKPWEDMYALSPFMRSRQENAYQEFQKKSGLIKGKLNYKGTTWEDVQRFGAIFMKISDAASTGPAWWGAYQQELGASGDSKKAIEYADRAIRRAQPTSRPMDLNFLQHDPNVLLRAFSAFGSYTLRYGNRLRESWRAAREGAITPLDFMGRFAAETILPAVAAEMLYHYVIWGRGGEDEEELQMTATDMTLATLTYASSGFPLAREMVSAAAQTIKGQPVYSAQEVPTTMFLEILQKSAASSAAFAHEGPDAFETWLWRTGEAVSFFSGVPVAPVVKRAREGMRQVLEEDATWPHLLIPDPEKR